MPTPQRRPQRISRHREGRMKVFHRDIGEFTAACPESRCTSLSSVIRRGFRPGGRLP